MLKMLMFL